jgi:hypothetical protein
VVQSSKPRTGGSPSSPWPLMPAQTLSPKPWQTYWFPENRTRLSATCATVTQATGPRPLGLLNLRSSAHSDCDDGELLHIWRRRGVRIERSSNAFSVWLICGLYEWLPKFPWRPLRKRSPFGLRTQGKLARMSTSLVFRTMANHSQSPEGTVWGFCEAAEDYNLLPRIWPV